MQIARSIANDELLAVEVSYCPGAMAMFETLRAVLHSGKISSRIQYMIEVLFAIRKDKFKVQHLCTSKLQITSGMNCKYLHTIACEPRAAQYIY